MKEEWILQRAVPFGLWMVSFSLMHPQQIQLYARLHQSHVDHIQIHPIYSYKNRLWFGVPVYALNMQYEVQFGQLNVKGWSLIMKISSNTCIWRNKIFENVEFWTNIFMRIIIPQVLIVIAKYDMVSVPFSIRVWIGLLTWSIKVETEWRQAFLDKHFWVFSMCEHGRLLFQYNLIFVGGLLVLHIFLLVCVSKAEAGLWALEWKSSSASNQQNLRKIKGYRTWRWTYLDIAHQHFPDCHIVQKFD